jgi:hypothetical protein
MSRTSPSLCNISSVFGFLSLITALAPFACQLSVLPAHVFYLFAIYIAT